MIFDKIFLNHGKPMTLGQGSNASSPLPTESFMGLVELFNNILCWFMQNCETLGT